MHIGEHHSSFLSPQYLQQFEGAVSDGGSLRCVLCDYSTQNSLSLVQHANSLSHQRGEGLLRLQRIQNGLQDGGEEELSSIFEIRKSHAKDNGKSEPCTGFQRFRKTLYRRLIFRQGIT